MNKKISPAVIGACVGAVALIQIAIMVFGSGRLFVRRSEFVLYFDDSVNGLRVGAPVTSRASRWAARSRISGSAKKAPKLTRSP